MFAIVIMRLATSDKFWNRQQLAEGTQNSLYLVVSQVLTVFLMFIDAELNTAVVEIFV